MTECYDLANGHRLEIIERRPDGLYLYRDKEDDSKIICRPSEVEVLPRRSDLKNYKIRQLMESVPAPVLNEVCDDRSIL